MKCYEFFKRILDLALAAGLLVIFLPFWIVIPVLIKRDSKGSVFFRQYRVGKDGKLFPIYKFRSMIENADDLLWKNPGYKKLRRKMRDLDWKLEIEDDPRITKLGRKLRQLSIDEFPQVFNIIKGEMSIVGPRAYRPQELDEQKKKYPKTKKWIKRAFTVKPGITGLWQVSGRNDVPFDKRVEIDAEYAQRRSLWEDLKILIMTPKAMISRW